MQQNTWLTDYVPCWKLLTVMLLYLWICRISLQISCQPFLKSLGQSIQIFFLSCHPSLFSCWFSNDKLVVFFYFCLFMIFSKNFDYLFLIVLISLKSSAISLWTFPFCFFFSGCSRYMLQIVNNMSVFYNFCIISVIQI